MKKLLSALLVFVLCLFSAALADTAVVTTPDELTAALNDDAVDAIEITADMTVTDSYVMQTKDIAILSDVVFQPAPDEGFFVKSWEIPEGVTLTVTGKLTTVHTFDTGFVIAQFYVNGGTLDLTEGALSDDCNICFNAGELLPPAEGFGPNVEVARYLFDNATEEAIAEALTVENLLTVTIQAECTVSGSITVPDDKKLQLSTVITVADGASVEGEVIADAGCGAILMGSGRVNDLTVPEDMEACKIIWNEDGSSTLTEYSETPTEVTIAEWLDAKGACGNCVLTVTVKEIINPALALVADESGEVNLFGVKIDGAAMSVYDANLQAGDVLTLSNPTYNVFEGSIEMSEPTLIQ